MHQIRKPRVAGSFYPANPKELRQNVASYFKAIHQNDISSIAALIVPHAGYVYSGKIAAAAYKLLERKSYHNVIIIAPSHFDYFDGFSIYDGNYETPLGIVKTNKNLADRLIAIDNYFFYSYLGHGREHSLEVQLPFLQQSLKTFELLPIVMGNQNLESAQILAKVLIKVLNEKPFKEQKSLIICSSDLSHFYDVNTANTKDQVIINDIERLDPFKLNSDMQSKKGEACGFGPIMAGMLVAKALGAGKTKILNYGTSGDINQDYSSVVGYVSAAIHKG